MKKPKFPKPKFTWDCNYGVGYIKLGDGEYSKTVCLFGNWEKLPYILADIDVDGNLRGIEIVQ